VAYFYLSGHHKVVIYSKNHFNQASLYFLLKVCCERVVQRDEGCPRFLPGCLNVTAGEHFSHRVTRSFFS